MSFERIPVKCHDVSLSRDMMGGGVIQVSQSSRQTEDTACDNVANGGAVNPPASDTLGDMKREGLTRCKRCAVFKAPDEFGTYKVRGIHYPRLYCKECRVEMERYKRFEQTPGYPRRME